MSGTGVNDKSAPDAKDGKDREKEKEKEKEPPPKRSVTVNETPQVKTFDKNDSEGHGEPVDPRGLNRRKPTCCENPCCCGDLEAGLRAVYWTGIFMSFVHMGVCAAYCGMQPYAAHEDGPLAKEWKAVLIFTGLMIAMSILTLISDFMLCCNLDPAIVEPHERKWLEACPFNTWLVCCVLYLVSDFIQSVLLIVLYLKMQKHMSGSAHNHSKGVEQETDDAIVLTVMSIGWTFFLLRFWFLLVVMAYRRAAMKVATVFKQIYGTTRPPIIGVAPGPAPGARGQTSKGTEGGTTAAPKTAGVISAEPLSTMAWGGADTQTTVVVAPPVVVGGGYGMGYGGYGGGYGVPAYSPYGLYGGGYSPYGLGNYGGYGYNGMYGHHHHGLYGGYGYGYEPHLHIGIGPFDIW